MKNKMLITSLLAASVSMGASAETFSVNVDITKETIPLSITQKTPMVISAVRIDESVTNGLVICTSYYEPLPEKSYCTGGFNNGVYTIAGAPFAEVIYAFDEANIVNGGMSLQLYNKTSNVAGAIVNVDSTGNVDVEMRGELRVDDKDQVTSNSYQFAFNMTAVYN
jgi:hypothetical protein